jgi:hypothetical protein
MQYQTCANTKGLSIPACFANLAVAAWIKFDDSLPAAAIVTAVMLASAAAVCWYHRKWTAHILTRDRLGLVCLCVWPVAGLLLRGWLFKNECVLQTLSTKRTTSQQHTTTTHATLHTAAGRRSGAAGAAGPAV